MRKITVREFKDYCDAVSPKCIIFSDENQDWNTVRDTLRIKLNFDNLKISFNPNIIHLLSYNGTVSLERVKYIKEYEPSLLGSVFGVVCGDLSNDDHDRTYTIVAR